MKEVTFLDRVPTYPGRVVLTPVPGQANTFDMVRADDPRVEGTPLDKATFDSMTHSRLTGRYYRPIVGQSVVSTQSLTANFVPAAGWVNESAAKSRSGVYLIEASSAEPGYSVDKAFDRNASTEWHSLTRSARHHVQISFGQKVKVKKMRLSASYAPNSESITISVQGSNTGNDWTNLQTINYALTELAEFSLNQTDYFSYYRLEFTSGGTVYAYVNEWQFVDYDIQSYRNDYTISEGVPTEWTEGQKVSVQTSDSVSTLGVVSNYLNGVLVNTVLQPAKRYELVYTDSAFVAKEV